MSATGRVRGYGVRLLQWLGERDRGFTALRRAGRGAIRLVDALRQDLLPTDGRTRGTAAQMAWTGDYLDALRQTSAPLTDIPDVLTGSSAAS